MTKNKFLAARLREVNLLHQSRREDLALQLALSKLKRFEKNRILVTYDDLRGKTQYTKTIDFMANDIFGMDFSERDAQMEKAYPALVRLLPESMLSVVTVAVELNIKLVSYENKILNCLLSCNIDEVDEHSYSEAFLKGDCNALRLALLEHVNVVAQDLDRVVRKPFISTTLKLCRGPANLAGLGLLQDFLDRGYQAFKAMKNSQEFLRTFTNREYQIVTNILQAKALPFDVC